jgi:hypothetical protein
VQERQQVQDLQERHLGHLGVRLGIEPPHRSRSHREPRRGRARRRLLLAALAAVAVVGCSNAGAPAADAGDGAQALDASDGAAPCFGCGVDASLPWTDPSLPLHARVVSMLHDCTGAEACHATGSGGLTILAGSELVNLVKVRSTERPELFRVAPGDPAASYMYLKLAQDGGFSGAGMPAATSYDPRRPALAWEWIEAGAP